MSWLRFKMDLTSEPSESLETSITSENSETPTSSGDPEASETPISDSFEPSEFPDSFEPDIKLVEGRLSIMNDAVETVSFKSTSGLQSFQYLNAQSLVGRGPIPSCNKIGVAAYTVRTSLFDLSSDPEVDENFYYIEPDPIDVDGLLRGEFGIQFDADSPGSAGSIVLRDKEEWQKFEDFMKSYLDEGNSGINLVVEYTVEGKIINPPLLPSPGDSVFTIKTPKPGESKKVNEEISFSGTAESQVSKIIATVEPEKTDLEEQSKLLFSVGEANVTGGEWSFSQTLVNVGSRPFKFRALDEFGNLLQTVEFSLVLVAS